MSMHISLFIFSVIKFWFSLFISAGCFLTTISYPPSTVNIFQEIKPQVFSGLSTGYRMHGIDRFFCLYYVICLQHQWTWSFKLFTLYLFKSSNSNQTVYFYIYQNKITGATVIQSTLSTLCMIMYFVPTVSHPISPGILTPVWFSTWSFKGLLSIKVSPRVAALSKDWLCWFLEAACWTGFIANEIKALLSHTLPRKG